MPSLEAVAAFLDARLETARFGDVPTLLRPSDRPVERVGLALEPADLGPGGAAGRPEGKVLAALGLDAVFLHRPFQLAAGALPELGLLAAHDAFDAHLTTGLNRPLAKALGLFAVEPVEREGEVVGMRGHLDPPPAWEELEGRVAAEFGGLEASEPNGAGLVRRAAVMSAMTGRLVEAAAAAGAEAYLTGQLRAPGREAAARLGVGVIAVGHRRSELWGLRQLGRELAAGLGLEAYLLERGRPAPIRGSSQTGGRE